MREVPENITLDGVEYKVSSFSDTVKKLVEIHTIWQDDLQKERNAVVKTELALRTAEVELVKAVQAELKAKAESEVKTESEVKPE